MLVQSLRFAAILLAAFSLSLSMTHLLEFPQRMLFEQQLWVNVTVVENVYKYFGTVGAVFEIGAILMAIVLSCLVRGHGAAFYWTASGALLLVIAFVSWIVFVSTANAELARWLTSPIPANWTSTRNQWEYAHAANALVKIVGFSCLVISLLVKTPTNSAIRTG